MSAVPSEAKEEVKVSVPKTQTQELTDLTSFNAYAFVTLSDGQNVGVQITSRHGIPADRQYADFKTFVEFLDLCAKDSFVKFVDKRNGTYPSEANSKPAEKTEGAPEKKARRWDEPVPQAELPAELVDVTVDVYTQEFDVIKVLPQPDDKANVEFWKDNLKFPVGAKINKAKYETIKGYLSHLELDKEIDPAKAGEYRVAGIQYWTEGAEYEYQGQKKHYKNIVLLKPAL